MRNISDRVSWRRVRVHVIAVILFPIVAAGCSKGDWKAETYRVQGSLTINGTAPEGAVLIFLPVGQPPDSRGTNPWANIRNDGTYVVSMYEFEDGAPEGEYAMTLRWPTKDGPPMDRLSGAFATADKAIQTIVVNGDLEIPHVALTGVKVKP
jgi:hypothetical protein